MAKVFSGKVITAIDVGTTKICVLVANQLDKNNIEIIGVGKASSDGLKKGVVVDIARTVKSIKSAVKEAEIMSGQTIESAIIGISGGHIKSVNSSGAVPIKTGQVRQSDIDSVLEAAKAVQIKEGYQILHVLPQYFTIDGGDKLHDPMDMHGIRLELQAHIITGSVASVQNLVKCVEFSGVKVKDIILEQLASAAAVLSEDEKLLGVGVLDIGGGTTDLALYQNGSIRHTMVLPVAGTHFTNDIAVGLRTTIEDSERIKKMYGIASLNFVEENKLIEVEAVQGASKKNVDLTDLVAIIEARATELFSIVRQEVYSKNLKTFVTSGFVITGGGSLLRDIDKLAQEVLGVPVRVGYPRLQYGISESLDSPVYSTGYGMLIYALKNSSENFNSIEGPAVKRIFVKMKSWVSDFF
ncbi:MAG: Cell division protein ftsA [candidate division TM6 bacterium GW2011_GWF2_30_66]|nr:MAG: Cell division protein ftsA [candidate division TM6 bacterium GW2011_GWF2_30_66]